MKYSFLGIGIIMSGIVGICFIVLFQSITINNEAEYYVLKEAMEAAMMESIDISCFRNEQCFVGEQEGHRVIVKISEQKFVENFTRRFASSINGDVNNYKIQFYDIIESPPKATVVITGVRDDNLLSSDEIKIVNSLSGILEHEQFANYFNDKNWVDVEENIDNVFDDSLESDSIVLNDSVDESYDLISTCANDSGSNVPCEVSDNGIDVNQTDEGDTLEYDNDFKDEVENSLPTDEVENSSPTDDE